jgi:hypothetical protein
MDEERSAHFAQLKESRMKTIEEYDALVKHLRARCNEQKSTIESLLSHKTMNRRATTPR